MSSFVILASLLICAVILVLIYPLMRTRQTIATGESAAPAMAVLREQRKDLQQAHAAGHIDDAALAQGIAEIEQRALAESALAPARADATAPATASKAWASVVVLILVGASLGTYLAIGNPGALDPQTHVAPPQADLSPDQINEMVAKLAAKVAADPSNIEGAQMLARSYMALDRFAEAADVLAKLSAAQPDNAQFLVDWADALASRNGQRLEGEPAELIARALKADPSNIKAQALSGTLDFERGQYPAAVAQWQAIIGNLPPNSGLGQSLQAMIGEAEKRMGVTASPAPASATAAASADGALSLKGEIRLAPALQGKTKPEQTLFIYLRPANGGPPIAGMRFTVADLPLQFDFSQAQRMDGGAALPDQVILGARISGTGQARAQAGDLQGTSPPTSPQATGLTVEIDTIVK